jgi:hypothetical protein
MPFDARTQAALRILEPGIARFRSALAGAMEALEQDLARLRSGANERLARLTMELGPFGARYVDVNRLAPLLEQARDLDEESLNALDRALATLKDLAAAGESLHVLTVPTAWDLADAVGEEFARIGRAFGAARVVAAIRTATHRLADHARSLGSFPFARWTRTEREHAPPLVVEVAGAELTAPGLAPFMDGGVKIVLVVTGSCSPAPLARLITPGVFVAQALEAAALDRFAAWEGPGIAALVPEDAARFVHDPAADPRLSLSFMPEGRRRPMGGLSVAQQAEELRLLAVLGAAPTAVASAATTTTPGASAADPADRLAAWLLSQADLSDLR